jgi:hypothetical protein
MNHFAQSPAKDDYVQQLWQSQLYKEQHVSKGGRVTLWVLGSAAVLSLAAYASQDYWYPYVAPYLYM